MQKIRYNFRQNDSILELNEHFLGLASPGVKNGLRVSITVRDLAISAGHLMTNEGVLITETLDFAGPSIDPISLVSGGRVDVLVAEYKYEEKLNPNTCEYKIVKGIEVATGYPEVPQLENIYQYPIANIHMSKKENDTIETFWIDYPLAYTRYDIGRNTHNNGEYHASNYVITQDAPYLSVTGDYAIVNGIRLTCGTVPQILVPFYDMSLFYAINDGLYEFQEEEDDSHDRYMLYAFPTPAETFSWDTVTSFIISVYHTKEDYNNGTATSYTITNFDNLVEHAVKGIWIPIPDVYACKDVTIEGPEGFDIEIRKISIKPVFIVSPGVTTDNHTSVIVPERVDIVNKKVVLYNNLAVDIDKCLLLGYAVGNGTSYEVINVRPSKNKLIFSNIPMSYGIQKLYHFLCRTNYALTSVDIEDTHFASNEDVEDITGTRSIHKDEVGIRIYRTGSGDPNKKSDYIIYL